MACLVPASAQAQNIEEHNDSGFLKKKTKKKKPTELLFWLSTVALHQGQDESAPAPFGLWAPSLVRPYYCDEPTLWCSLIMW